MNWVFSSSVIWEFRGEGTRALSRLALRPWHFLQYSLYSIAPSWSATGGEDYIRERAYDYSYDKLNRITGGTYHARGTSWATENSKLKVDDLVYDYNGNITSLRRKDLRAAMPSVPTAGILTGNGVLPVLHRTIS